MPPPLCDGSTTIVTFLVVVVVVVVVAVVVVVVEAATCRKLLHDSEMATRQTCDQLITSMMPNHHSFTASCHTRRTSFKVHNTDKLRDAVGKDELGRLNGAHHRHERSCGTDADVISRCNSIIVMMKPGTKLLH